MERLEDFREQEKVDEMVETPEDSEELYEADAIKARKKERARKGLAALYPEEIPDESSFDLGEKILEKIDAGINGEASDEVVRLFKEGKIDVEEEVLEDLIASGVIGGEEVERMREDGKKPAGPKPKLPKVLWEKVKEFSLPAEKWNKLSQEEQAQRKEEVRKAKREYFDNKLKNIVERARSGLNPREWDKLTKQEKAKRLGEARSFYER